MSYSVVIPVYKEITFNKNPVDADTTFKITIKVADETVSLEAEEKYAGEFYLSEV